MSFKEIQKEKTAQIEQILKAYLPRVQGYQEVIMDAMSYSMLAGGKRLRPMLMQETYRMFGGTDRVIEPFMAAIEMIIPIPLFTMTCLPWIMMSIAGDERRPMWYMGKIWES